MRPLKVKPSSLARQWNFGVDTKQKVRTLESCKITAFFTHKYGELSKLYGSFWKHIPWKRAVFFIGEANKTHKLQHDFKLELFGIKNTILSANKIDYVLYSRKRLNCERIVRNASQTTISLSPVTDKYRDILPNAFSLVLRITN